MLAYETGDPAVPDEYRFALADLYGCASVAYLMNEAPARRASERRGPKAASYARSHHRSAHRPADQSAEPLAARSVASARRKA
jgi:hypothetical protein